MKKNTSQSQIAVAGCGWALYPANTQLTEVSPIASDLRFQFSPRLSVIMQDFYTACRTGDDKLAAAIIADLERQHCDLEDFLATLGGGGGGLVVEDLADWSYYGSASYNPTTSRASLTNGDFYEAGAMYAPDTYPLEGLELDFGIHLWAHGLVLALVDPSEGRVLHKNNSYSSSGDQYGNGFGMVDHSNSTGDGPYDPANGELGLNGVGVYFYANGVLPSAVGVVPPSSNATVFMDQFDDYGAAMTNWRDLDKGAHVSVLGGILTVSVSGETLVTYDISSYGLPANVRIGFTQAYGAVGDHGASQVFNLSGNVF